ncbi:hypothetical protein BST81_01960 [Leptolyngbya sp. 'hensonii']|uniref:hypothetical protein n=1 Tax=Leptolyngbya sp. 'hensonii' TaxID=1922337 RepID=UPI00094FBC37|nr:hypothetical protein [Leptolyngbya sp. 'hensonii']OLP20027.1 hypothetical protein BST81_01960 [Leptolyngbya sp. 'hensonii']
MKSVLELISKKQQAFAQLPFFQMMQDSSIDPRQRLAFAPCFAPFTMGFGELNRFVFREEPSNDAIQTIINQHSYEDDTHWIWFLEDLQKLEFDLSLTLSEALQFLWSDATQTSRQMVYELYRYAYQAPPLQKLVVIEAIEATADIFLSATAQAARELQMMTGQEYRYFGNLHLAIDTGHSLGLSETEQFIAGLHLSREAKAEAFELVDRVFDLFTHFFEVMLRAAEKTDIDRLSAGDVTYLKTFKLRSKSSIAQPIPFQSQGTDPLPAGKPIGTYLVEAGLLTSSQLELALHEQNRTARRLGEVISSQGWVNQQTIEYLMEKVVLPERELVVERPLALVG